MASRKGKTEVVRPTIEEIKQQPGSNLFVVYEGVDKGPMNLPAHRPRFAGDIPEEITIEPWMPIMIHDDWLDDVRFRKLYNETPGIRAWKSDEMPKTPDFSLPEELATALNQARQQTAFMLATNPYTDERKQMINIQNIDVTMAQREEWENTQLYPFLEAVLYYETMLAKRPDVLKDVKKRLTEIDAQITGSRMKSRWKKYGG